MISIFNPELKVFKFIFNSPVERKDLYIYDQDIKNFIENSLAEDEVALKRK